jgi:hypothetical protein
MSRTCWAQEGCHTAKFGNTLANELAAALEQILAARNQPTANQQVTFEITGGYLG